MPVTNTDMKWFLSGGTSNTDPNASLGGDISNTEIVSSTLSNLFDNVTGDEAASGEVTYRCAYLKNDHLTDGIDDVKIWIQSQTPSPDTSIDIALDPNGVSPGGAEMLSPEDETSAPDGVVFEMSPPPESEGTALFVGAIPAQQSIAVWFRRTILPGAASVPNDPCTIRMSGVPE